MKIFLSFAVLLILGFIFFYRKKRKIKKEKELSLKKTINDKKRKDWEVEKEKVDSRLSVSRKVKCDDGVVRNYDGFMFGIIKELKSRVSLDSVHVKNWKSNWGFYHEIYEEKWFSEGGITLNETEIINKSDNHRILSNHYESNYAETIIHINHTLENRLIFINEIMFHASIIGDPTSLFTGIINGESYKDGKLLLNTLNMDKRNYKGSALEYIRKFIIPNLPDKKKMIGFTSSIYDYLKGNDIRYIRKFKNYKKRGKLYNYISKNFIVVDNEPALWIYLECKEKNVRPFIHYHEKFLFPIAFALSSEERKEAESHFNFGKQKREKNFSKTGLKHCHILDCSPRGFDLIDLSLDQRMLRLASPLNHFPFPSPRHFEMKGGDIGESIKFLNLIKHTLYNEFYTTREEKHFFLSFLKKSGDKTLIPSLIDDFEIELSLKKTKDKIQEKINNTEKMRKPVQRKEFNSNIDTVSNFKISKKWYGQKKELKVQFKKGNHQKYIFIYDHDYVYDNSIDHLKNLNCWDDYGYYVSSKNIPSWANNYVTKLNN